jgi:hypothetical protein
VRRQSKRSAFERSGKEGHERISLLAALRFAVALHVRRRQRLDQQTLSFAAATAPAEAHIQQRMSCFSPSPAATAARRPPARTRVHRDHRHAGPGFSIISRSPLPPHLWHFHSLFNGRITTGSGARLASSAKRSRFFPESACEIQWVRHVALIAGSPLRLMGFAFDQPIPYPSGLSALVNSN